MAYTLNKSIDELQVAVVGGGSWGTALAQLLASKGYKTSLWVLEEEVAESIAKERENKVFLPDIKLSENITPTLDLEEALKDKDMIVSVVPSEWLRETALKMKPFIKPETLVVSATKGIEIGTRLTMSGILRETLTHVPRENICVISGPSFAKEVAKGMPTVVTVAASDPDAAMTVQEAFATPYFRVYTNTDLLGVEVGGAVKNVMAIASGICEGLGFGANTRAALITRGLNEMRRLGRAMGAKQKTFSGLAGVGDLVLTCTADLSRNYTFGKKIGQGMKREEILSKMRMVAEGVRSSKSVYNLAIELDVEMPIVEQTYKVLYEDEDPAKALFNLMTRKLRDEHDDQYG
ncbi:glycerol 3-phosphate dehydrogenase (NAD(P)+) [Desulfatibacillum alkenivorans DSM 16219]|jgi:glycerol-3-phosphate dehydrogenase (NAD(P)+)|uniref:Glycerol-3-phosphate dehydrogenase [NAD(P)+] n=1 Tax=Desulfatibacillum alkenivorans DSM 16219 TaxID=1121393 RepID=A0A1M6TSW2_9BACT|nr:NAD(P)H-dependent glycerol-3-phosphate dehydrogenase [Desulfatibacillum alkenivorans]SHK60037.1 glycerol 3-phosphate dehydrogenase (NAD(P)+) [Desulfatibacillum alkenivorans DSM 16219]